MSIRTAILSFQIIMMLMMLVLDDVDIFSCFSFNLLQAVKKTELLDNIVEKTGVTKVVASKVVAAVTEAIAESLVNGKKGQSIQGTHTLPSFPLDSSFFVLYESHSDLGWVWYL